MNGGRLAATARETRAIRNALWWWNGSRLPPQPFRP